MARLRIIAGPNGSGKTTLTDYLRSNYNLDFGYYLNADEIEKSLRDDLCFHFQRSPLKVSHQSFLSFYHAHPLLPKAAAAFVIRDNSLYLNAPLPSDSYFPALLADFLRQELLKQGTGFSFETVMSDHRKVVLLKNARQAGYRTYLYYVCIKDPDTNTARVKDRVQKKGHNVPEDKILDRYKRSLDNLLPALRLCDRAYLFDNSGPAFELVAELNSDALRLISDNLPNWLEEAVINKL